MASYRLSVKHIARGRGQSASRAAAYRSGEKVRSEELIYTTKAKYQDALNKGEISTRFHNQLEKNGIHLSDGASVEIHENRWEIINDKQSYTVRERMTGRNNDRPELSIYQNGIHNYAKKKMS